MLSTILDSIPGPTKTPIFPDAPEAVLVDQLVRATRELRARQASGGRTEDVRSVVRSLRTTLASVARNGSALDLSQAEFTVSCRSDHRAPELPLKCAGDIQASDYRDRSSDRGPLRYTEGPRPTLACAAADSCWSIGRCTPLASASSIQKRLPEPGWDVRPTAPPIRSAARRTRDRPMPTPGWSSVLSR